MSKIVEKWVEEQAKLTKPDRIHWIQGTEEEMRGLVDVGIKQEKINSKPTFQPLNHDRIPPLLPPPQPSHGRGKDRASHVRLPAEEGRRGSE